MIATTFTVECDGSSDDEDADFYCEAEFDYVPVPGDLGNLDGLYRQMDLRGWRRVTVVNGPLQVFCPLHREQTEETT